MLHFLDIENTIENNRLMYNISRQDSSIIKGLLTILIVIGHNHIVAPQGSSLMLYLYTFHVMCFFILPWLYDKKKDLTLENIGTTILRAWIPYVFFFVLSLIVFMVIVRKQPDVGGIAAAFVTGSQALLKENVGFFFLWFLPTFCTFSLLKLVGDKWDGLKCFITILSICTFIFPWRETEWMKNNLPFGMYVAFRYYIYGFIVFYLLKWQEWIKYVGGVVFLIFTWMYWNDIISWYNIVLMPVVGFMFVLSVAPIFRRQTWLQEIGKYSLPIYLLHVYVYNVIERVVPHTMIWGFVVLVLTLVLSYFISYVIYKMPRLKNIIFPRNVDEWKSAFL